MSDLWLPPSARGFDTIGDGVEAKLIDGEIADRMLGPDDAIFLPSHDFGVVAFEPGEDPQHLRETIPWVGVEFERLRQGILDRTLAVELYGINEGFATSDGTVIPFPDGPQLYVRFDDCHVYVGPIVGRAPDGWLDQAMTDGFMLVCDELPSGQRPWFATGPMGFQGRVTLPGVRRAGTTPAKVGRNQPCPCGSDVKYKFCCGR